MSYISNYSSNTVVNGTNSADSLFSNGVNVTIYAGDGNDTIENRCYDVTIDAGAGDDYIRSDVYGYYGSQNYQSATIYAGDGNDTVYVNDHRTFIDGGAGKDSISINGGWEGHTLKGGIGDDTIYGGRSNTFLYSDGDGNDTLYNVGDGDKISIESNKTYSRTNSGNDVIIKVGNGSMTLKNAVGKSLNITTVAKKDESKKTQQDVIKDFMSFLDETTLSGSDALDNAINYASGGKFTTCAKLIEKFITDCQNFSYDKFLKTYCRIDLSNKDTGAITGWDAGGLVVTTAESIVEETGILKNFTGDHFKVNGLEIQLKQFDKTENGIIYPTKNKLDYNNLSDTQKYICQALYTWWAGGALDLISESYGNNYGFTSNSSATAKTLYFGFYNEDIRIMAETNNWENATKLSMAVNIRAYPSLKNGGNPNGEPKTAYQGQWLDLEWTNATYLDRTLAHEMTHAVMMATINNFSDLPQFIKEGVAELTHGIDDVSKEEIKKLAKNPSELEACLDLNNKGTGVYSAYVAGYMLLRYFARQCSTVPDGVKCNSNKTIIALTSDFKENTFDVTDYFSTVTVINASSDTKAVKLIGNNNDNIITASSGGSEIIGGRGKDILHGGKGKDIFVYAEGDGQDTIYNYTAGKDKIKLTNGSITSSSLSGSDVVLKIGNGSIKVKNAKDKKITVIDSNGNETSEIYPIKNPLPNGWKYGNNAKTNLTANDTNPAKIDLTKAYGTSVVTVNGATTTKAISIIGNTKANSIKGGSGSDTLKGGVGNDTIYGGNGKDSILGETGNDRILGDAGNDILYGGAGNDTLYGGADDDKLYGDAGSDKLMGDAGKDTLYGGAGNDTIYGGVDNDKLYGDAGDDRLYGDAGNDSLYGGSGNDTFTGGAGNDVFIYEGGKDVITDYTAGDKIEISSGKISKTSYNKKDVIFTIGSGSLTVKNGKGKKISVTDSSNKTQTYSKTLDLFYDNNFVTDELRIDNISEVTETDYSVGQIHPSTNYQNLLETNSITSAFAFEEK